MSELALNMTDLKAKIEKLVTLHKEFKQENENLKAEILNQKKLIDTQNQRIEQLEKENKTLQNKTNEEKNNIVVKTNEKINELVQEIDDCIALLNK